MRSALSPKTRALDPMPHGQPVELTVEKAIMKAHRVDVLRALAQAPAGLPHHPIQYEVVKGSAASTILSEFVSLGLVEWRDNLYFITSKGKEALSAVERLRAVVASNGNGGVGGSR
jgi:predicted transcriptional regulator